MDLLPKYIKSNFTVEKRVRKLFKSHWLGIMMFYLQHFSQSINKVGLSVCLCPINVETAEPIGPNFYVGHHVTQGRFMDDQIFKILPPSKFDFWKFWKSTKFFLKILDIFFFVICLQGEALCIFTNEIKYRRKAP